MVDSLEWMIFIWCILSLYVWYKGCKWVFLRTALKGETTMFAFGVNVIWTFIMVSVMVGGESLIKWIVV